MRVLMVTVPLPTADDPNTMAPLARQIDSLRQLGVEVNVLEIQGLPKLKYLQTIPRLRALAPHYDIIHAHYGFCGWLARLQKETPLVVSFMGDDLLGTPKEDGRLELISQVVVQLDRWFARWVDSVIVKSAEMAQVVAPIPAHVVPNGVNTELFKPLDRQLAKEKLGWSADKRYILFPGNPANPRKQYSLAQQVVEETIRRTAAPLELVALNQVSFDQVPYYMNGCEAMLMMSYIEGSPNVVKEGMACDMPIISVPVGDVAELLDGVAGCYVRPRHADQLADALVEVLSSSTPAKGREAIFAKGLDLNSVAQRLVQIYQTVLPKPQEVALPT